MNRRPTSARLTWLVVAATLLFTLPSRSLAQKRSKAPQANQPAAPQLRWLDSLTKGYTFARQNRRPILVRVGTQSCPHCVRLAAEISKPTAQKALQSWTLVELDADKSPSEARSLAVSAVPALRLLTPAGKLVVSHDGAMSAKDLVDWLKKHHKSLTAAIPTDELGAQGPPSVVGVVRLIREFKQRNAVLREAAIRRLMPHPDVAAVQVVAAFQEGRLTTKLAALELLTHWKAPVQSLDPWRAKTLTKDRLAKLGNWATTTDFKKLTKAKVDKLTAKQLQTAKREIDRMIAGTDSEAVATRERLARFGKRLLPEVLARLKATEADGPRARLTALRYRLVASPRLVLQWPGGIERLASTSVPIRERAADELAKRVSADDEALLLELFSDDAPLIREIALRSLRKVGGDKTNSALLKLLDDPEPNVRAAVLKQLAEKPSATIAKQVAAYSKKEKDTDLLVHAARVLREVKTEEPAKALLAMLTHKSWRVRAEAAEGLGKIVYGREWLGDRYGGFSPSGLSKEQKAAGEKKKEARRKLKKEATAELIKRLSDEDGFVIGRAMKALDDSGETGLVKPLVKVADSRPGLTAAVVKMLGGSSSFRSQSITHLRRYAKHKSPSVRAAAVTGVIAHSLPDAGKEVRAALKDKSESVRIAALLAMGEELSSTYTTYSRKYEQEAAPRSSGLFPPGEKEKEPKEKKEPHPDQALIDVRAGKVYTKDVFAFFGVVQPSLAAKSAAERHAAAMVLAQLGKDKLAIPVLRKLVDNRSVETESLAYALPLLLWKDRAALFDLFQKRATGIREVGTITRNFATIADRRALPRIWKLFERKDADAHFSEAMLEVFKKIWFGPYYYRISSAPLAKRKRATTALLARAKSGAGWQRITALKLLTDLDKKASIKIGEKLFNEKKQPEEIRLAACRHLLQQESSAIASRRATENLTAESVAVRRLALAFLAQGTEVLNTSSYQSSFAYYSPDRIYGSGSDRLIYPKPPAGVKVSQIEPFLRSEDAKTRARAGYLLVIMGKESGLTPLMAYYRGKGAGDPSGLRLVYRALSHLDDPSSLPTLRQIYLRIRKNSYMVRDFYWTVRIMNGREALAFRKRIRDEVGMDNLR